MTSTTGPPTTAPKVPTRRVRVRRHDGDGAIGGRATLAVEEPLEIRIDGAVVAVTMRTPGQDFDLAVGFAITDGGVNPAHVQAVRYCGPDAGAVIASPNAADLAGPYTGTFNSVSVTTDGAGQGVHRHRSGPVSSACGICGADVVDDLTARAGSVADDPLRLDTGSITQIPRAARRGQHGFDDTGATHAAGAYAADGDLVVLREDVGRHNAVDKVIGALATDRRLPASGMVLFTSGRIAFEIVAKALIAGFPAVVGVSAPTSLAVDLAEDAGLTLIGFARDDAFTVYTRPDRIGEGP